MMAGSFPSDCKDAHGLRVGAIIAALGGHCAERSLSMATRHSLSTDGVITLSDSELARLTYEYIGRCDRDDASHDDTKDALYFLVTEVFERFAPNVERAQLERDYADSDEQDLLWALEGMRRREATRMIRDALREDDDA
jgi:hypothetical protein